MEHNKVASDSHRLCFARAAGGAVLKGADNTPMPHLRRLATDVFRTVATLASDDPAFPALRQQVETHLRHVGYTFKTENRTYPHAPVLQGAYPAAPTRRALQKAANLIQWCRGKPATARVRFPALDDEAAIRARHKRTMRAMTDDPMGYYTDARARLTISGDGALFPEYADTVDMLLLKLRDTTDVSPLLAHFRQATAAQLIAARDRGLPYRETIDAIEYAVEFFDVLCRTRTPESCPPLYHSHRYEYYLHYLSARTPDHIFLPTIADLGVTDLLKMRGVPVGFIGVSTDLQRVDGFTQTPYEFFMHDVNHARRMEQFAREECERRQVDDLAFYRETNLYVRDVLLPRILPAAGDDAAAIALKKTIKMVLFEVLHEDALPACPDVIRAALLRPPSQLTPFERIDGDQVVYIMEPGATTLAYVYRKLAHTFYDAPENRRDYIAGEGARSRESIVTAAQDLFVALGMTPPTRAQLAFLTGTDEGFPDDFRQDIERDIKRRGLSALNA